MAKSDNVTVEQHEKALVRIRTLEARVEQIVHALATGVGISIPDADSEDAGNAEHA